MKGYTVVGYYADNNQPWVEFAEADSAKEAAEQAVDQLIERDSSIMGQDVRIVEAFEGKHFGCLNNETVLNLQGEPI